MGMFTRKLTCDNFTNLIAPKTAISGNVYYDGVLKVQGTISGAVLREAKHFEGDYNANEFTVIIDDGGLVFSRVVSCKNAIIKGKLHANELRVDQTLRIHAKAELRCAKIYYRFLEIEPGAVLHDCQLIHIDHVAKPEAVTPKA